MKSNLIGAVIVFTIAIRFIIIASTFIITILNYIIGIGIPDLVEVNMAIHNNL